jgi:hypothetical protein
MSDFKERYASVSDNAEAKTAEEIAEISKKTIISDDAFAIGEMLQELKTTIGRVNI